MNFRVPNNAPGSATPRVLLVVHGYEPAGWAAEVSRLLLMWTSPIIRVLAVVHVPTPPCTSLTPFARKEYRDALRSWKELEELRVHGVIDQIVPPLAGSIDIVQLRPSKGRLERAISDHAHTWSADVVVISAPERQASSWLWPGPVHRRLLEDPPCPVMITKRGA